MSHITESVIINDKEVSIDKECIDLVLFFNKKGLETKCSCQGGEIINGIKQPFQIMFSDDVIDGKIQAFLLPYLNKYNHTSLFGRFCKWGRFISGKFCQNWIYSAPTINIARQDYKIFSGDFLGDRLSYKR